MGTDIDTQVQTEIIALYERYFGSTTSESYKSFYADKDLNTVLASAKELFIEYAGEKKSQEILDTLYKKYNIAPKERT